MNRLRLLVLPTLAALLLTSPGAVLAETGATPVVAGSVTAAPEQLARGRYLVRLGGCNDCHTAGYAQQAGRVAESEWLLGDDTAHVGPWGTSFATNLRLTMLRFNDAQWLEYAHALAARPPMPWFTLHEMSDDDLLAVLRFVQWLGPRGEPAPPALPPGEHWLGPSVQYGVIAGP